MVSEGSRRNTIFDFSPSFLVLLVPTLSLFASSACAQPQPLALNRPRDIDPVNDPDRTYLPAQIGGIVGAYAVSLVLVAILLLALSKRRREHLNAANDEIDFAVTLQKNFDATVSKELPLTEPEYTHDPGFNPGFNPSVPSLNIDTQVQNFSYPSPTRTEFTYPALSIHTAASPVSTVGHPGISPLVDQRVVQFDKAMAQAQLEDMYKHVMEHEAAKKRGEVYEVPYAPGLQSRSSASGSVASLGSQPPMPAMPQAQPQPQPQSILKKERVKPTSLNLNQANIVDPAPEERQSKTSSLLSALRSPRKKAFKGVSISAPMMTPQSATFPRFPAEAQEMNPMSPRLYAPAAPPPLPTEQVPLPTPRAKKIPAPITPPDISPESVMSIDERIGGELPLRDYQRGAQNHSRAPSMAPSMAASEMDPQSATSEHSQAPLVGLPASPKPGARFSNLPSLPASPRPGSTFSRSNKPSAVRTGGALPLRAYDNEATPTAFAQTTKQTVFERRGPLSPGGGMTPYTAGVPYTPYQPFTPCVPMTPSLVTKQDRKRMKRMVPKTPTLEMVESTEDIW